MKLYRLPTGELVFSADPTQSGWWQTLKSDSVTFCLSFISVLSTLWLWVG